jgi:hypothetical protein
MKYKIPDELGNVDELIRRFDVAKQKKDPWITHLRECYEYALPQREIFNLYSPGQKKNIDIFDSTAVIGAQKFASRLQATLVPPWRNFSILTPGSEIPEKERDGIQKELDKVNDVLFDHINHSNFATQAHEAFLDLSVSTGVLTLEESDSDESLLDFNAAPLAEVYPEEGPRGTIETVWREHSVPARHVDRLWPGSEMSAMTKKKAVESPDSKITLLEGTVYAPKSGVYYQCVIERDAKHVVFTQTYEVSPWIVFREMVVPGEVLGRGRIMQVLPDIKTCNKVVEFVLRNAALAIGGVYTAQDDGVINPYTLQIAPGVVIPVGSNDSSNPTLRALDRAGDFNVSELILTDLRDRINKSLFSEPFGDMSQPVKSATEMSLRGQELVMDAGSAFARLQTEFIEKVVKRSIDILKRNGKVPDIRVDGKEVTIKHTSPLARAQDQSDLLAVQQFIQIGAAFGPEMFGLGAKIEDMVAYIGKKLGIKAELLRTADERKQLQEQAAQAAAAQQQQVQMAQQQQEQ